MRCFGWQVASGGGYMNGFFAREFWRFVSVQQEVAKLALTAVDYPPMQDRLRSISML